MEGIRKVLLEGMKNFTIWNLTGYLLFSNELGKALCTHLVHFIFQKIYGSLLKHSLHYWFWQLIVGLWTHNQSTLHSVKPVMVILHWRSRIEPMHSTIGIEMMMGKKYQLILSYSTISTGKYCYFLLFFLPSSIMPTFSLYLSHTHHVLLDLVIQNISKSLVFF